MDDNSNMTDILEIRRRAMSLVMYKIGMYQPFYHPLFTDHAAL